MRKRRASANARGVLEKVGVEEEGSVGWGESVLEHGVTAEAGGIEAVERAEGGEPAGGCRPWEGEDVESVALEGSSGRKEAKGQMGCKEWEEVRKRSREGRTKVSLSPPESLNQNS
jgi:hypothetical protein